MCDIPPESDKTKWFYFYCVPAVTNIYILKQKVNMEVDLSRRHITRIT